MAYKVLADTDIKAWNDEYDVLAKSIDLEADPAEQAKITAKMQSLGTQVEEHLNEAGRQIRGYFDQHNAKVNNWLKLSEQALTNARKAAAAYKKDPSTGVPAQPQQAVADMTLWSQAIVDDAREFGAAWFNYRGTVASHVPEKYQASFKLVRAKVMEDQKAITNKEMKIRGYIAEAQGLVKVAAKTTMKAGIKAGTEVQRPMAEAQHDAAELARQMEAELNLLRSPTGLATQPAAISSAMERAKENSKDKTFTKNPGNVAAVNARKKTFESAIKLMRTRAASMDKVLATHLKSFRNNELSDPTVKAEIKKAQQSLKAARADLAVSEAEVKKGLGYIADIEKRWAAKAK